MKQILVLILFIVTATAHAAREREPKIQMYKLGTKSCKSKNKTEKYLSKKGYYASKGECMAALADKCSKKKGRFWDGNKCQKIPKLSCYRIKESSKKLKCKRKKFREQQCPGDYPFTKDQCKAELASACDAKGDGWGMKGKSCKRMKPKDICKKKHGGYKYKGSSKTFEPEFCFENKTAYEQYKCEKKNKGKNPPKYEMLGNKCKKIKKKKCYELKTTSKGSKCKKKRTHGSCTEQGFYESKDACYSVIEQECRAKEAEGYVYKRGKCKKLSPKKKCKANNGYWYKKATAADGTHCFSSKEEVEQKKCDIKNQKKPGKYAMQNGKCKRDRSAKKAYKAAKKACKKQGMKASKEPPYNCVEDPSAMKRALRKARRAMKKECRRQNMKVSKDPDESGQFFCVEDERKAKRALKKARRKAKRACKKQGMGVSEAPNAAGEFECVEDARLMSKAQKKLDRKAKRAKKKECRREGKKVSKDKNEAGEYYCVADKRRAKRQKKKECKKLGMKVSKSPNSSGEYECVEDRRAMLRKKKKDCRKEGMKYDKDSDSCVQSRRQLRIAKKRFCKSKGMKYKKKKDTSKTEVPDDSSDPASHGCVESKRAKHKLAKKACKAQGLKYDKKANGGEGACVEDVRKSRKKAKCDKKIEDGKNVYWDEEKGRCKVDKTKKNAAKLEKKRKRCEKKAEKKPWFYFDEGEGKCKIDREVKDARKADRRKEKCEKKAIKRPWFSWDENTKRCVKSDNKKQLKCEKKMEDNPDKWAWDADRKKCVKKKSDEKCDSLIDRLIVKYEKKVGRFGQTFARVKARMEKKIKRKGCMPRYQERFGGN